MRWNNNIKANIRCYRRLSYTRRFQRSKYSVYRRALSSSLSFLHSSCTTTSKLQSSSNSFRRASRRKASCVWCVSKLRLGIISLSVRTKKSFSISCCIWSMKTRLWSMTAGMTKDCQGQVRLCCMSWDLFWPRWWAWVIRWWSMTWTRRRKHLSKSCSWTQ